MAEVTWRATLIGALILFLIGVVVATCLNYTQASLNSIRAGLNGPYECNIEVHKQQNKRILCNDTGHPNVQDCIYVFVSFKDPHTGALTRDIKLSHTYLQEKNDSSSQQNRIVYTEEGEERMLGQVTDRSMVKLICLSPGRNTDYCELQKRYVILSKTLYNQRFWLLLTIQN